MKYCNPEKKLDRSIYGKKNASDHRAKGSTKTLAGVIHTLDLQTVPASLSLPQNDPAVIYRRGRRLRAAIRLVMYN